MNVHPDLRKGHFTVNYLWLFVVVLGPILLGGAVFYAIIRQRRLTRRERINQDAATRELYEKDERADIIPMAATDRDRRRIRLTGNCRCSGRNASRSQCSQVRRDRLRHESRSSQDS